MSNLEADLYEDLGYEEAEGISEYFDEENAFDEDYEAYDEDSFEEYEEDDETDEMAFADSMEADEYAEDDEYYEEFDEYESDEEAEDAFDSAMAYALGAEDADEFFGRLFKRIKRIAKKAAPVIGRVARVAAPILSKIPHPYAQIAAKGASLLSKLRAEGASEEEALEAFAELAARDKRALPLVAGLTARTVLKSRGARMSFPARKKAVKDMKSAAKILVRKRGPKAIRALPKIAKSVKRTAVVKGTPVKARPVIVKRAAAKVARKPAMVRKLARPSAAGRRLVGKLGGMSRSYTIQGPARITISAA